MSEGLTSSRVVDSPARICLTLTGSFLSFSLRQAAGWRESIAGHGVGEGVTLVEPLAFNLSLICFQGALPVRLEG